MSFVYSTVVDIIMKIVSKFIPLQTRYICLSVAGFIMILIGRFISLLTFNSWIVFFGLLTGILGFMILIVTIYKIMVVSSLYDLGNLEELIDMLITAVKKGIKCVQMYIPTAVGKTILMMNFLRRLFNTNHFNSLVMTGSTIELVDQHADTCTDYINHEKKYYPNTKFAKTKIMVVCCDRKRQSNNKLCYPSTTDPVKLFKYISECEKEKIPYIIFCTYHSLEKVVGKAFSDNFEKVVGKDYKKIKPLDATFYDEAHNTTDKQSHKTVYNSNYRSKFRFFATATPRNTKKVVDGKIVEGSRKIGMDQTDIFGEVLYEMSPKEAIDQGLIAMPRVFMIKLNEQNKEKILNNTTKTGAFTETLILEAAAALSSIQKLYEEEGRIKAIVYAKSVDHAKYLCANVNWPKVTEISNIKTYCITSKTNHKERARFKTDFKNAENAIMFNYRIFNEGINIEDSNCVILLRSTKDSQALIQIIGRVLRIVPEDRKALKRWFKFFGKIVPHDPTGWKKPYGYLMLPETIDRDLKKGDVLERIKQVLIQMYNVGYKDVPIEGIFDTNNINNNCTENNTKKHHSDNTKYNIDYINSPCTIGDLVEIPLYSRQITDEELISLLDDF